MTIRKLKRRAMARLSDPRVGFKVPDEFLGFFAGMTSIERENFVRDALHQYVKHWEARSK